MVGPFKTARGGMTHLLVTVDKFTKWIEAKPIKKLNGLTAVTFISDITAEIIPGNHTTSSGIFVLLIPLGSLILELKRSKLDKVLRPCYIQNAC